MNRKTYNPNCFRSSCYLTLTIHVHKHYNKGQGYIAMQCSYCIWQHVQSLFSRHLNNYNKLGHIPFLCDNTYLVKPFILYNYIGAQDDYLGFIDKTQIKSIIWTSEHGLNHARGDKWGGGGCQGIPKTIPPPLSTFCFC